MAAVARPPERRLRILTPLAERDFRLLWAGQTVSLVGDGITTIALAWQTYELTRSPVALSLVLLARSVPMLVLLLIGGAVSDRLPRRAVMLSSDLVRGATVGAIAILSASGLLEVWHLVVLAGVFGAADAFFQPAYSAIFPDLLPKGLLVQANSLTSATRPVTLFLAGPALGGLLVERSGAPPRSAPTRPPSPSARRASWGCVRGRAGGPEIAPSSPRSARASRTRGGRDGSG
jgi:MFS family permease